jgi:hypothetical protein
MPNRVWWIAPLSAVMDVKAGFRQDLYKRTSAVSCRRQVAIRIGGAPSTGNIVDLISLRNYFSGALLDTERHANP